jgi:HSP20 family protein
MLTGWRDFDDTFRAWSLLQRRIDHVFDDWTRQERGQERGQEIAQLRRAPRSVWPAINAFETKEAFVYRAQVPGLGQGDVAVYVEDGALVLRGERKADIPEGSAIRLRERAPVAFTRKLPLPGRVDADAVLATMKDGILTVTLPKAKDALPRQVTVTSV